MSASISLNTVYCLADGIELSRQPSGELTPHAPDASATGLNDAALSALAIFAEPKTFRDGVTQLESMQPGSASAAALDTVCELVERGWLIPGARTARIAQAASATRMPRGMFGCPSQTLEQALQSDGAQVLFVGMPYDKGATGRKGSAGGPAYIRQCSKTAFDYTEQAGRAQGWWHPFGQRRVLEGVRFADLGDLVVGEGPRNDDDFDRIYDVLYSLFQAGRFPVLLGGDHSVSLPAITAAATLHPGLGVIHFDAHGDIGALDDMGDWRRNCSHGNFMSWVAANPNVASVHQFGLRHLTPDAPHRPDKVCSYWGDGFLDHLDFILDTLPRDRPYYLTFDVDCLDLAVVAQTGTPVPGGLSYKEAARALGRLASRRIVGMDWVELMPAASADDYREGTTVSYLMFETLASVFSARGAEA
ncbi:arginase family protein [Pseudogulbenkiania ferrooxidans]|uniref:arginase family protein n=1 Tax=Pseudogulbenkiania ferrooxidans TaxID=549169 RepID=UPI00040DF1BE|nr:arginase family protein [Pseudogulbenkiania ferrooxidans]